MNIMESLGENKPLTGGDQKIEEYVSRIKNGESKDSIFQGLPESFKSGIEKRLAEPTEERAEQGINEIPPQYRGLDSETLDFIWTFPEYVDSEKTRELKEKKARALTALREKESAEMAKTQRHEADQKKIEELREQLGIAEPLENAETQESNSLQKKEAEWDDDEHRRAVGIYNTMVDIASGMKEGLKEDIERKIQKYVDEIKSGKDEEYVLQGLPDKWKNAIRDRLGEKEENINYDLMKPEDILRKLAEYSEPYMSAPVEAVADGTFAGMAKLKIENGSVILVRHASDEEHLIKQGKSASAQEMMDSSLFSGGAHEAGAVHTSADVENWAGRYDNYPVYGEFRIPVKDFLDLAKNGKAIIGNLSEAEIVLSGDIAKKYLTGVFEKKK